MAEFKSKMKSVKKTIEKNRNSVVLLRDRRILAKKQWDSTKELMKSIRESKHIGRTSKKERLEFAHIESMRSRENLARAESKLEKARKRYEKSKQDYESLVTLKHLAMDFSCGEYTLSSERELEDIIVIFPEAINPDYRFVGRQIPTDCGRLDLLLESDNGKLIVAELKKGQGSESSVSQIQRYLVWVEENYAQSVMGILVADGFDKRVRKAAEGSRYDIRFLGIKSLRDSLCMLINNSQ
ncbi:MAG: endonuclease NucS domain-containing protein [Candidatus Thorarchaeota archaeon]